MSVPYVCSVCLLRASAANVVCIRPSITETLFSWKYKNRVLLESLGSGQMQNARSSGSFGRDTASTSASPSASVPSTPNAKGKRRSIKSRPSSGSRARETSGNSTHARVHAHTLTRTRTDAQREHAHADARAYTDYARERKQERAHTCAGGARAHTYTCKHIHMIKCTLRSSMWFGRISQHRVCLCRSVRAFVYQAAQTNDFWARGRLHGRETVM